MLRCVEMLRNVGQESTDARLEAAGQELVGICRISWVFRFEDSHTLLLFVMLSAVFCRNMVCDENAEKDDDDDH